MLPGAGPAPPLVRAGQADLRPDRADRAEQDNEQRHLLILQDLAQRRGLRQSLLRHRLAPWVIALFGYHNGTCMLRHRRTYGAFCGSAVMKSVTRAAAWAAARSFRWTWSVRAARPLAVEIWSQERRRTW